MHLCIWWWNSYPCLLVLPPFKCDGAFLYKTPITSVQNSKEGNSTNVTALSWAKLAKRWQALLLSDAQTNGHQGLTYTSRSSLGEANVNIQLSKLLRHQSLLWYRRWVRVAVDQIINPHNHIMWQFFLTSKDAYMWGLYIFLRHRREMRDYTFFWFLLTLRSDKPLEICIHCYF